MSTTPTITTYTTTNSNDDNKDDNNNDSFVIVVNNFVSEKKYLDLETKYNRLKTKLIAIHNEQKDERRKDMEFKCDDKIRQHFKKCDLSQKEKEKLQKEYDELVKQGRKHREDICMIVEEEFNISTLY